MLNTASKFWHPKSYIDRVWRPENPCGYCHCDRHRGYLNRTLIKKHCCVEKNCKFLEKYKNHTFWHIKKKKTFKYKGVKGAKLWLTEKGIKGEVYRVDLQGFSYYVDKKIYLVTWKELERVSEMIEEG